MKACLHIESRIALAGLLLGLVWTASTRASVIHVPADYFTIQMAVNAAGSNDTIQIAAGVYAEQVVITNKTLTLIGSPGAVLRATPGMAKSLAAYVDKSVPLLGIFGADVVVSGLTFEGERLADSQTDFFFGIYFLAAGGRVENCRITGFRGNTLGSGAYASGIVIGNPVLPGTGPVKIQVLKNIFADNYSSLELGGTVSDPAPLRITFVVHDNSITGNGPDATGVQNGIIIYGDAGGEVARNTITDHSYNGSTAPSPYAHGVLAGDLDAFALGKPLRALHPVRYEGNVFRDNQQHLGILRGDGSTIVNNSFQGTGQGVRPFGIGITGLSPLIDSNRFSNMGTGILLFGKDPDFGTYLGVATHAQVTANRFCNVTTNVLVEPQATDSEQGTLTALICPPPELSIAPAALLSWPDDGENYALESAPDPHGPWLPFEAAPTMLSAQVTFAVRMDSQHRYFRLHQL